MHPIKKDSLLSALFESYPGEMKLVFRRYGLECLGCGGSMTDSLEKAAVNHGMDVDLLIKEIKREVKKRDE